MSEEKKLLTTFLWLGNKQCAKELEIFLSQHSRYLKSVGIYFECSREFSIDKLDYFYVRISYDYGKTWTPIEKNSYIYLYNDYSIEISDVPPDGKKPQFISEKERLIEKAVKDNEYKISWRYICEEMEKRWGVKTNSTEEFYLGHITTRVQDICMDFMDDIIKEIRKDE